MGKRDYILRLLGELTETWPIARALVILVESNIVDDNLIDILINTIESTVKSIMDQKQRTQLENAKSFLQTLKGKEMLDQEQDKEDIIELEKMLAKI